MPYLFRNNFFDYGFAMTREPIARAISEYRFRAGRRYSRGQRIPAFPAWWVRTRRAYDKNPFVLDNHIRPQVEFLCQSLAKKFDVFRFEDGVISNVEKVFRELDVSHVDLGIHTHRATDMPIDIDEATFDSLTSFYSEDIAQFGYDKDEMKTRYLGN